MFQHIAYSLVNRQGLFAYVRTCKTPTSYNNQVHGCCNNVVQSCYFTILWQHVLSCMNMAVDLSWWFQQRCSSLFVHQAMNSLFQHAWTTMFKLASSTTFKLASSTMFKLASLTMFKLASSTMFKLASSTMFKLASSTIIDHFATECWDKLPFAHF